MNYQIKATTVDVVIGSKTFTTTPVDLVTCGCLGEDYRDTLFNAAKDGDVVVQFKGVDVANSLAIISKVIQFEISGLPESINTDWETKARLESMAMNDTLKDSIDKSYDKKEKEGSEYYRSIRATVLKDKLTSVITDAQAKAIYKATKILKLDFNTGDWMSAQDNLNDPTEVAFPSGTYEDALFANINADLTNYIAANY